MAKESPYVIRTAAGSLVGYAETEEQSIASAQERNERAIAMGLGARYVASHEPN